MPYFNYQNQRLFYAHHKGDTQRPSLLLIHGAGGNRTHWPKLLRPLDGLNTYVVDLPGHGRSDPPGCDNIPCFAAAVSALVTHLGQPIVLAGHSMGGAVAQTVALASPSFLAGLILIGTSARLPVGRIILDNVRHAPQKAIAFISQYAWSESVPLAMKTQTEEILSALPPALLFDDFTACSQFDSTPQVGSITVPTLVISGAKDKMTPAKYGRALADAIPNAEYYCLEGAGHYMMMEQPAQVAALMKTFIERALSSK